MASKSGTYSDIADLQPQAALYCETCPTVRSIHTMIRDKGPFLHGIQNVRI